jgi:hypothetical protein
MALPLVILLAGFAASVVAAAMLARVFRGMRLTLPKPPATDATAEPEEPAEVLERRITRVGGQAATDLATRTPADHRSPSGVAG